MCGVVGYWRLRRDAGADELYGTIAAMSKCLAHRGPDSDGHWIEAELGLALGHRRLSIIDISAAGHQPMVSADGRYVIILNGEIYNFETLRRELEAAGGAPAWRGHSDTEVLLAMLAYYGAAATLPKLNGMFAFAYADLAARKLFLARDRFGEKPLYIYRDDQAIAFASELKPFKTLSHFDGTLDRAALSEFMTYAYVPAPRSIYAQAQKLLPAHYAEINLDAPDQPIRPIPYWSALKTARTALANPLAEETAADRLDELLHQSVQLRMMSDVPLGSFLSGGVDSSIITALMQAQSARPVKTFSIGFEEQNFNEAHHAREVATHLGTDHTEHIVTPAEAMEVIPQLPLLYDEPFADSSQIPTYLLSKIARQQVTVSLSGDGGDEIFGGYNRYVTGTKLWRMLAPLPRSLRAAAARIMTVLRPAQIDQFIKYLPFMQTKAAGDKLYKLAELLDAADSDTFYNRLQIFWPLNSIAPSPSTAHPPIAKIGNFAANMMLHDTMHYLPDDVLVKLDRASMGVSLEARAPFLDPDLFAFAWSLPAEMKIRNGKGKHLLRQVLYRYVPQKLIDRPKMGFGLPIGDWLRGPLRAWAEELLSPEALSAHGLLTPVPIQKKWAEHLTGRRNWQTHLWPVLMFEAWRRGWDSNPR